jgi:uncharacterized membrane protein YdjX (TVP38/TMEM64 family)
MPRGDLPIHPDGPPLGRVLALAAVVVIVGLVVAYDPLHGRLSEVVGSAEALIERAPLAGMAVFVVLSALSAMFAFFSSGLLSPVAIAAWGKTGTFALLWLGWLLGGAVTYAVGRYLGRSAARVFVRDETLALWEGRVSSQAHVTHMLLFQLAMPSEILGYVLGLVRYSFRTYLAVLALTEVPYALAVVYLGESFLAGDARTFVLIGVVAVAATATLYYLVRRAAASGEAI